LSRFSFQLRVFTFTAQPYLNSTRPDRRPFEGELAATTLWPEVEKVFGHGYEVSYQFLLHRQSLNPAVLKSIAIASSHSRELLATACRATSPQHAVVRVYSTSTYQPFGSPLEGHTLTVTRITFSPDDEHIITVSRDRTWRAFRKEDDGTLIVYRLDPLALTRHAKFLHPAQGMYRLRWTNRTLVLFGIVPGVAKVMSSLLLPEIRRYVLCVKGHSSHVVT